MMGRDSNLRNVVLFPFMAQGHLIPFLALAKLIKQRKDFTVTIVNTPLNIKKMKSLLPPDAGICFAEIPFCATEHGLPPEAENTDSLSHVCALRLMEASETLQSPFRSLIVEITEREGCPPACIISDMFLGWSVVVANELGIYHSVFIAGAGFGMSVYFSISVNPSLWVIQDQEFLLPDFPEASLIHRSRVPIDLRHTTTAAAANSWFNFRKRQFLHCFSSDAILLNSVDDLEDVGMDYFSRKTGGKPVWAVGPASFALIENGNFLTDTKNYSAWLDLHPPASVVYVSFGSQISIPVSQMQELALGLEASGQPFIWVARPPTGFNSSEESKTAWWPDGFEERIRRKKQGLVIHKWAPQLEILSHKSIGAFLSHCGWNSILESLCFGIPIIGWPLAGEQFFNSQWLEKKGVCLEVHSRKDQDIIGHECIAEVIQSVMDKTGRGCHMRTKANELMVKLEDAISHTERFKGSSTRAMDEFLDAIKSHHP